MPILIITDYQSSQSFIKTPRFNKKTGTLDYISFLLILKLCTAQGNKISLRGRRGGLIIKYLLL